MFDDDSGADFLSAKLVVVVTVASLLLVLLISGVTDMLSKASAHQAMSDARRVCELSRLAYLTGVPGCQDDQYIPVTVPRTVQLIAFGAASENGTIVRSEHACCIVNAVGSSETFVSDVPFARYTLMGPADQPVVLHPGKYILKASLTELNGSVKVALGVETV